MASSSSSSKFPTPPPRPWRRRYPNPTPPPPPSSIPKSFLYDVFLSFRGIDTRNNFTGHLYDRLVEAGIHTFKDDPELRKGQEISMELMRAIEESRICIAVFSQNYAYSRWCLDELVKIKDQCKYSKQQVLIPVFYDIQPSDVRWQKGSFKQAFRSHEAKYINQPHLVPSWRRALYWAAGYSGFDLERSALGSESKLISLIIKEVLSIVKPRKLFVAKYPIGVDSRVTQVYSLIRFESPDINVQFIGIWGMGGTGKTVIAKALYNKLLQSFDSSCFLANVREQSQQPNGLEHLQEKLISRLLMRENVKVDSVDEGIEMIKKRLCRKKVLIVLDDTNERRQVDALAGHCEWFGPGSIIIITTRDKHLLNQGNVYEAKELNAEESLELFSWHSFNKRFPEEPYVVIAEKILSYSSGLPLALEVLGAYLFGRKIEEWNSAFDELQRNPHPVIQKILQISYDGLDYKKREIFLDIACFFVGMDIDYVKEILNGCGFSTEIGIRILKERCLLTIDINNELRMHDLLRDMGREIIWRQYPGEPGRRSRVWIEEDAIRVLMRNKGTEAITGVTLVSPREILLNTRNFARMDNLRLLNMDKVNLDGGFEHLSQEIRWFRWQGCSLEHLPSSFEMPDLVVLDMQHSRMNTVWHNLDFFVPLKILNLSHSNYLKSTPDFTKIPNLVTLILEGCTSLLQIDPSIGCLHSLTVLNLKGCQKITNIPSEVFVLQSLGYLNLSGCSNLQELPGSKRMCESLREIYADDTAISKLNVFSYGLENLTTLSLRGCTQLSSGETFSLTLSERYPLYHFSRLPKSLRRLDLRDCGLFDNDIPGSIGEISSLLELDLSGNHFSRLPESFKKLENLESLTLSERYRLYHFSTLPKSLRKLNLRDCGLFDDDIPDSIGELSSLVELDLSGNHISRLPESFKKLKNLESLSLDDWSILPPELAHLKPTS